MEKILIIAEKPSLAKTIAGALKAYTRQDGYFENDKYIVSFAFGHLFELYDVEKYLGVEKLPWKDTKLPFIPDEFKFNLKNDDGVKKQFGILKKLVEKEETIISQVIATIKVGEEIFEFKGETVKQEGFLKYEPQKIENNLPKFKEGDTFKIDFKPVKKKTSPPKAVTEEELANYLKNPFRTEKTTEDEEYKAIFEGVEIGTEATRTGIIENAKHNNYISQKGSNFSLEPLGEKLIEILDKLNINLYKDKTVEFSKILKKVYRGETKIDNLIEMTKKELEEIIKTDAEIEKINKEDLKEDLGECPLCKVGKIREMKTKEGNKIFYNCSNKECKFFMWEDTKYYQSPIKVTKAKLKSLLAGKKVAFKLISKAGKEYEMYLKLQVDGKFVNFKDDGFVNKKKK